MMKITLLLAFHLSISLSAANRYYYCSAALGNYTIDSPYMANLEHLFSELASNNQIDHNGFYNLSSGREPDQANLIALCRGDVATSNCHRCLNSSIQQVKELCPYQKEAIIWYDTCMLRYTNRSIFGTMEEYPGCFDCDPVNASDPRLIWNTLDKLLTDLQSRASKEESGRLFATGEANVTRSTKVYGLVQCTPDLSEIDCFNCLHSTIGYLQQHCYGSQGGRDVEPSCNVMFEMFRFYDLQLSPPSPPPLPPAALVVRSGCTNRSCKELIGAISVATLAVVIFLLAVIFLMLRKRRGEENAAAAHERQFDGEGDGFSIESLQYDFEVVKGATRNFSEANKLGRGGFGSVYKGILSNGQQIAVKRLAISDSGQGELEFKNEVMIVAK